MQYLSSHSVNRHPWTVALVIGIGVIGSGLVAAAADLPQSVEFSIVETAREEVPEAVAFSGGRWTRSAPFTIGAVLVRHPRGAFLFDSGFGAQLAQQLKQVRPFERFKFRLQHGLSQIQLLLPAAEQLRRGGVDPARLDFVVLSHLHWDHASGVTDFADVPIWVDHEELAYARSRHAQTPPFLGPLSRNDQIAWRAIDWRDEPALTLPRSLDVFGDQSAVLLPLPGHTPGSVAMLITLSAGRKFLFVGDTVWQSGAIARGAPKSALIRGTADQNPRATLAAVRWLRRLRAAEPALRFVPAHDADAQRGLAHFPRFER